MSKRRQELIILAVFATIVGLAVFAPLGNWLWNWNLPLGARTPVREKAAQSNVKAAVEPPKVGLSTAEAALLRALSPLKNPYGYSFHDLRVRMAVLRGEPEALTRFLYGDGPEWAEKIRSAYPASSTLCAAYFRWEAADQLRDFFSLPSPKHVTVEELKTSEKQLHALWRSAGISAAQELFGALKKPSEGAGCVGMGRVTISQRLIEILDALGVGPEAIPTTSEKIAELVRAAG